MTARHRLHIARPGRPARWGFTLVELLLVMFILSVLVGMVVGVSWYVIEMGRKKETLSRQKNLIGAIEGFRKVTGHVPGDLLGEGITFEPDSPQPTKSNPAEIMSRLVYVLQTGSPTQNTNPDTTTAIYKATSPFLGESGGDMKTDSWGNSMLYIKDGGVGGKPVIVSAGPDGKFGYGGKLETGGVNKQYQKDNVRSDMN
jgi:prepilin-type N-terminal cleavage/methylation domain-containing protein